jgi:hypothetical protein
MYHIAFFCHDFGRALQKCLLCGDDVHTVVIGMQHKGTACFFVSLSALGLIHLFLNKDG